MIKGIIFDLMGPIMTEDADIIFEKHSLHRRFERDMVKKLIKKYYHGAHQGEFKDIADFFEKTKPSIAITVQELNEVMEEMHTTKRINPEMIQLILELRKKYKVALLTNFTSDLERFLKDMFNIYHIFDIIVNSYDIKAKKPDPKAFLYTLEKLGLEPRQTIFIDDKEENVEGAQKLGIKGIVYRDFVQFKEEFTQALVGS